ncbi:uncharacterized protein LOC121779318 isoform X1 [Salvia splendens]|uniref:uncharacterized protein LOC121779318 isoform X1 n=1 Tax=Salvia splendens TaxID=180675 RepID=UPI001C274241|nr:uncharacterized protein LOC121779318 isoform X1 [Salvia splendens]XP_042032568.1 uncharacterized protein LOC121779318 isoform X1 [Salvia splendens]XP_042032569.1 uncharacterized protein LOC121779318 isoform X1 [Salvia splendens]XP_042032570.1 uncharacterized protein LOC121779318 isoform X1 [Salvia splendens]XP_042032571.1 uncharacterized protein LOC121779318 isoform X1 [Salvia splendens]
MPETSTFIPPSSVSRRRRNLVKGTYPLTIGAFIVELTMSDFHVGVGRTDSLPSISDPASSLDPIKVMIEHILARMARLQTRMDEYDRRQSSRHTLQPDPEPPHSRGHSRPLEGPLLFTQPFAAVSVTTPPPPAPISLPRSPDFRDQVGAEEVLLDVEEKDGFLQAFEVANFKYVEEAEKVVDEEVPAPPSEGLGCSSLAFVLAEEIGPVHIEKYSQLASPIVPPPPPQHSHSCWSSTSPTSHCCSAAPLPAAAAAPSLTLPPPAPPCSPNIFGVEEALLDDEEKVRYFAILVFARVRGEKCSSRDQVERNELLRAHCFTFGILEELVNHSSPIGGVGFSKEDISFCSTLNLIQSEKMVMVTNGVAFIPRRHSCPFDPGGDIISPSLCF